MGRRPDLQELAYERLGDRFADALSSYDTRRRVDVLVDGFLTNEMIRGKRVLDVGCGLGFFSERLASRGATVTACDIGPGLVDRTRQRVGCDAVVADALCLVDTFGRDRFDAVVSSECIEHTPSPLDALTQIVAVVKPGGLIALSTPNRLWQPIARTASRLGLRPFDGYENFSTWTSIRRTFEREGAEVVAERGLHLFPFQFGLHGLSTWCDEHLQGARALMINLCVLARKSAAYTTRITQAGASRSAHHHTPSAETTRPAAST
jgi:2-polyprenyl-6-hydroxyphenyl methylase/3-demethylubiquinone-9 3-methyltransferase